MGAYKISSHNGCNQILTIVDDFTRFTWVHLLKSRTECVKIMSDFLIYIDTQFKGKILRVRSDNALELCQGAMKIFFCQREFFRVLVAIILLYKIELWSVKINIYLRLLDHCNFNQKYLLNFKMNVSFVLLT